MLRLLGIRVLPASALVFVVLAIVLIALGMLVRMVSLATGSSVLLWVGLPILVGGVACVFLAVLGAATDPGS